MINISLISVAVRLNPHQSLCQKHNEMYDTFDTDQGARDASLGNVLIDRSEVKSLAADRPTPTITTLLEIARHGLAGTVGTSPSEGVSVGWGREGQQRGEWGGGPETPVPDRSAHLVEAAQIFVAATVAIAGMGIKVMMKAFNKPKDIPSQVPPLTPGTNKKMAEALKATFASWEKEQLRLGVPKDPRQWSEAAVAAWLRWAAREFSLEGVALQQFARAQGKDICAMGRDEFVARAPAFMGDILWEHLEILQKDVEKERSLIANVPPNMYESNVCLPELAEYIPPPAHHYNNNNTDFIKAVTVRLSVASVGIVNFHVLGATQALPTNATGPSASRLTHTRRIQYFAIAHINKAYTHCIGAIRRHPRCRKPFGEHPCCALD
ncbi:ETS-like protein pointed, isoform P2/D [Papilio machaon]|uniref:ETS-like protein pointed, isoform P2/D n=1 Tax=Papilio machaon TaxID=76193 RepID=A0A194RKW7_PAPMA|nr:ETS-like protein pointed, isoform P2/D [Papilio machaon]